MGGKIDGVRLQRLAAKAQACTHQLSCQPVTEVGMLGGQDGVQSVGTQSVGTRGARLGAICLARVRLAAAATSTRYKSKVDGKRRRCQDLQHHQPRAGLDSVT